MKQALFVAVALLTAFALRAQAPTNDAFNCATMVNLGEAPACQPTVYTNRNATPSVVATVDTVSCFQTTAAQHDVWFRFQCPITLLDVRVTITGTGAMPITNPEFAIYRGDCQFDGLAELNCASAGQGQIGTMLDLFGLTPGLDYYLRVSDWSATAAPNWGDFTVCVDSIPPIVNVTQGSSSLCAGTLYDSGGEFGDYLANEDHTFVICPDQQSECISFTLEYYNLEPSAPNASGQGDELSFYDGNSANAPLLASLDGAGGAQQNISGGGGVCFRVQATSGCLTVVFESDGSVQEEGWKGTWQCNSDPCLPVETLAVDTSILAADIVDAVSTGGAMVTVTNISCDPIQFGTFKFATESNDLNMEKGLLLTSGRATNAEGPNTFGGLGTPLPPFFTNDLGDADLNYLSNLFGSGSVSQDACIVELDVFAATNEMVFEYVFGSEEYPEFVFSPGGFNDIFAFLVSGPGIAGDPNLTNGALNIAVLPNSSSTPVQIDSVNNHANWQYYRNNELGQSIQYDGLTSDFMGVKKSLT
ncbi:MAG: choice-of-anchor L domain-containing protein, partial [Saprospiraceae bacterium]